MNSILLRSRRSSRATYPLSQRLFPQPLSTILITLLICHQSQPLQPLTLLTSTSLVLTFFQLLIPVKFREEFQVVEVLLRFLGIINILIALLFNQILLLISLSSSIQYFLYLIFAFIVFQLDIVIYDNQGRSFSQFQQRYIEYRVQSRSPQQFKLIINQSNFFNNLKRSDFLKI